MNIKKSDKYWRRKKGQGAGTGRRVLTLLCVPKSGASTAQEVAYRALTQTNLLNNNIILLYLYLEEWYKWRLCERESEVTSSVRGFFLHCATVFALFPLAFHVNQRPRFCSPMSEEAASYLIAEQKRTFWKRRRSPRDRLGWGLIFWSRNSGGAERPT